MVKVHPLAHHNTITIKIEQGKWSIWDTIKTASIIATCKQIMKVVIKMTMAVSKLNRIEIS